jgi:hypothetical protein
MIETLIYLVIYIIITGLVLGLLLWVIDQFPLIPEPFRQMARVLIVVVGCLILVFLLLSLVGVVPGPRRL